MTPPWIENRIAAAAGHWSGWMGDSLVSGLLALGMALLLARVLRRRAGTGFLGVVWLLVLARVAVPVNFSLPVSLPFPPLMSGKLSGGFFQKAETGTAGPAAIAAAAAPGMTVGSGTETASDPAGEARPETGAMASSASAAPASASASTSVASSSSPPPPLSSPSSLASPSGYNEGHPWLPALFMLWATGALTGLLWLALQARRARRLVRRSRPATPEDCPLDLTALAAECGLRRAPRARVTADLPSPAVTGLMSPVLLLPEGLAAALTPGQLRWAAAHELSHLRRGDLWVQLFESVMKCLFFFHPAVWIASRQLAERREECCDHAASALTGLPARESTAGLLTLLRRALPGSGYGPGTGSRAALSSFSAAALGMSGGHRLARRRMRRLLDGAPPDRHALFPWTAAALVPAAAALSLGAVRPADGEGSPEARRIRELESRVAELEGRLSTKTRRETLRENAEAAARVRARRDTERYSPEELHAMELIYQEAKKRPDFDSMIPAMQPLFDRFPASNRAGCAALYLGRRLEGEERARLLTWAADSAGDCLFLDGTTVGGLARILLARDALSAGRPAEAATRLREARAAYADGIDFEGNPIAALADDLARELP